nr:protein LAZ1 homolog 1-like [Quercus suber]XP_023919023.1 protein LAZ1 homolog 1-like [Quercus suber]POE80302.1 protein laz1 like 1 [Quercus suber]POF02096.1 protein laz1 like 1 [Quercus suber]
MGIAAVVHLYVFPAVPYKRGERCVRNVAVMTDYASLGTPPDPEEVRDSERSTRIRMARNDEREKRLNFPQSVRDVVLGSGEIIVDDMKYTVSHVVEPVEKGFAKINKTLHQISENVKRYEEKRRSTKDDSYLIPMNSWSGEFSEVHDNLVEGSVSDSGLSNKPHHQSKASVSRNRTGR